MLSLAWFGRLLLEYEKLLESNITYSRNLSSPMSLSYYCFLFPFERSSPSLLRSSLPGTHFVYFSERGGNKKSCMRVKEKLRMPGNLEQLPTCK